MAQKQCLFKDSTFNLMVSFLAVWKIFSNLVQRCVWQVFFYRSHSTGQNTGHCATDFKQDQKCLLALILIQTAVFDQGEIRPSQKNVLFPIALPLVKVGGSVGRAKK